MALEQPRPERLEDYALSVLLHDIGKFWERSSEAPRPAPAELQLYCPHPDGATFLHQHAALSARFIGEMVPVPGAARWGPRHHLPDPHSREEVCAHLADLLAGGRLEPDESRDAPAAATTPLRSILSSAAEGDAPQVRYRGIARLDGFDDSSLPRPLVMVSREDYRYHWNHFLNAADKLGGSRLDLETWCALLEVFTGWIPAASTSRQLRSLPDVDLYSHSRAVAALAVALYRGPLATAEVLDLRSGGGRAPAGKKERPLATLVAGELTGREAFLRALPGDGAAASLRGRALFLDLLGEAIARRFAARLELPWTSILIAGAERFVILAPPGVEVGPLRDEVDRLIAGATGGELGLEAASVDLGLADLLGGLVPAWLRLGRLLADAGASRLSRLARADYDRIFGEVDREALSGRCDACGRTASPGESRCALCASLEELGEALGRARFLARRRTGEAELTGYRRILAALDAVVEPITVEASGDAEEILGILSLGRLDLEELERARAGRQPALGFRLAGSGPAVLPGSRRVLLRAGIDGPESERLSALAGPEAGLARILAHLTALRHHFSGWAAGWAGRKNRGDLTCLPLGDAGVLALGAPEAALGFAEDLFRGSARAGGPAFPVSMACEIGDRDDRLHRLLLRGAYTRSRMRLERMRGRAGALAAFAGGIHGPEDLPLLRGELRGARGEREPS